MIKLNPVAHGKHNNIHFVFNINDAIKIKIVVFIDTQLGYITDCYSSIPIELVNLDNLIHVINRKLEKFDYELFLFSNEDFDNKRLSTEDILKKISN